MDLQDKVVVVTGAGSGLGRAISHKFAALGSKVVGIGHNQNVVETGQSLGDTYTPFIGDVSNFGEMQEVFDQVHVKHGHIDILFNNAAQYIKRNFLDESIADWEATIATNINGIAICCKLALPKMIDAGYGRIYNLGSWADIAPIENSVAYSASKGAVHALTKAIAKDISDLGLDIEVHEWIPGHLNTKMSDFTGIDPEISAQWATGLVARVHESKHPRIFENDREWMPPMGLRDRLKNKLLFWR